MPVSIVLIIMLLVGLLSAPPDKKEMKVEMYREKELTRTALVKRTPEGFSFYQTEEEMKFKKVEGKKYVYEYWEPGLHLLLDLTEYIPNFESLNLTEADNIKLKLKDNGPIIHLVRKSARIYVKLLSGNANEFSEEQKFTFVVY